MPTSNSSSGKGRKISLPLYLPSNSRSWRDEESSIVGQNTTVEFFTPMDGCIVHHDNGLLRERLTKGIKTGDHHAGVYGAFKHKWMQVVLAIHKPEHIDPPIFPGRQLDDALGLLPSIGKRGIKRKASFIKIIQSDLTLIFLLLQRFKVTFGLGKGVRVSEAFERFSHPLPSKTGSFC